MTPKIDSAKFGSITIEQKSYGHDIWIDLNGKVKKRKKKLSKAVYGTSHILSLDEAKHIFTKGTKELIIGSGQMGVLKLSEEAEEYLRKKECTVHIRPTPKAIKSWNEAKGKIIGLFHVTC